MRFEQYERSKSLKKMRSQVETFVREAKRMPKPQEIVKSGKLEELESFKKVIDSMGKPVKK